MGEIALIPSSEYFFTEFFIPLLERTPDSKVFTIIWDESSLDRVDPAIKQYTKNLPSVARIIEVAQLNGSIRKSAAVANILLEQLSDITLLLAMDICSPVMLLVAPALEKRGTKVAFAQCSGLHQHMWLARFDEFCKQTSSEMAVLSVRTNASKILNVSKYPKYGRVLFSRFVQKFNNSLLSYIVAPLTIGQTLPKPPVSKVRYFNSAKNRAVMIYCPDADIFADIIDPKNIIIAKPPYFDHGNKEKEDMLLIAFPGPLSTQGVEEKLTSFFKILQKVIAIRKPKKLLYRCHPRESLVTKKTLVQLLEEYLANVEIDDASGKPLPNILSQCHTVVAGVSNLLAVARATSKTRLVIGVKHAGLEGILGTNIQYQDIGEVLWVSSINDLDEKEMKKTSFAQQGQDAMPYYDALLHLMNDSSPIRS